jgi:hypothetical protein
MTSKKDKFEQTIVKSASSVLPDILASVIAILKKDYDVDNEDITVKALMERLGSPMKKSPSRKSKASPVTSDDEDETSDKCIYRMSKGNNPGTKCKGRKYEEDGVYYQYCSGCLAKVGVRDKLTSEGIPLPPSIQKKSSRTAKSPETNSKKKTTLKLERGSGKSKSPGKSSGKSTVKGRSGSSSRSAEKSSSSSKSSSKGTDKSTDKGSKKSIDNFRRKNVKSTKDIGDAVAINAEKRLYLLEENGLVLYRIDGGVYTVVARMVNNSYRPIIDSDKDLINEHNFTIDTSKYHLVEEISKHPKEENGVESDKDAQSDNDDSNKDTQSHEDTQTNKNKSKKDIQSKDVQSKDAQSDKEDKDVEIETKEDDDAEAVSDEEINSPTGSPKVTGPSTKSRPSGPVVSKLKRKPSTNSSAD